MSLAPRWRIGDLDLTEAPFLVRFGADYGTPENVTEILLSLLQDGDIEVSERTGNRTLTLPILIEDVDLLGLAEAEAALVAECDKQQNELYVDPGDGFAAPMVFDVFRGQASFNRDDNYEMAGYRAYSMTFRAHPFPRSDTEVVTAALAASGSTTVVIDACTATTGWTGSETVSTAGGAVKNTSGALSGRHEHWLQRTIAAVDMSVTTYLLVEWSTSHANEGLSALVDGVPLVRVASQVQVGGTVKSWFTCPDPSVTVFKFTTAMGSGSGGGNNNNPATVRVLSVFDVSRTDIRPSLGTERQLLRAIAQPGSARTQAVFALQHETSALGDVMVYTFADDGRGFVPPQRNFLTASGATTADAALVSGARNMLDTQMVYDIPAASLYRGAHGLLARLRGSSAGAVTLNLTARTRINATDVGTVTSWSVPLTLTTGWVNYVLGPRFVLPTIDLAGATSATVRITIVDADTSGIDVDLDEAWLFNFDVGALTQVACGTAAPASGGTSNRVWLLPATVDEPRPRVLRGFAADQSDAFYAAGESWGNHEAKPPSVAFLTVCSNALAVAGSARGFPRFHTHATPVT